MNNIVDAIEIDEIPVATVLDKSIGHVFIVDSSGICTCHSITSDNKDLLNDLENRSYLFTYKSIQKNKYEMIDRLSFDLRFFSKSHIKEIIDKCDISEGWISLSFLENCFYWQCRDKGKHGIVFAFGKSEEEATHQYQRSRSYSFELFTKKRDIKRTI